MDIIQEIDFAILDRIQAALRCGLLDFIMVFFTDFSVAAAAVIPFVLLFMRGQRFRAFSIMASCLVAALLTEGVIKLLVMRERPYILNPEVTILIGEPLGTSFPSSHTCLAFAAVTPLFAMKRKIWGIIGVCFAVLTGFSRLYLYVHFPSDVLVGALLGTVIGIASMLVFKKTERAYNELKSV